MNEKSNAAGAFACYDGGLSSGKAFLEEIPHNSAKSTAGTLFGVSFDC